MIIMPLNRRRFLLFFLDSSGRINYMSGQFHRATAQDCFSEFKAYFHNQSPMV
jgi:hypothetical protein